MTTDDHYVLEARDLSVGYAGTSVVADLNLAVRPGEVMALLGANGVGKSTTMRTLAGALTQISGEVRLDGVAVRTPLHTRASHGLSFVSEERSTFARLTTRQNLMLAGCPLSEVLELFPELESLLGRSAGLLSGGEQQMVALGRALTRPGTKLLLADELSLGLAPKAVRRLHSAVRAAADAGMAAVLVEQHVHRVLEVADTVLVLGRGTVQYRASAAQARSEISEIQAHYLGGPSPST